MKELKLLFMEKIEKALVEIFERSKHYNPESECYTLYFTQSQWDEIDALGVNTKGIKRLILPDKFEYTEKN